MKVKTQDLTGAALDLAVARAWYGYEYKMPTPFFNPSVEWNQGGPIIERERIDIEHDPANKEWSACWFGSDEYRGAIGPTPLIAAMRCYVASRLGDEVDVPKEFN